MFVPSSCDDLLIIYWHDYIIDTLFFLYAVYSIVRFPILWHMLACL